MGRGGHKGNKWKFLEPRTLKESLTELDPDILERTSACWYEPVKDTGEVGEERVTE